jgi:nitrite reductase/ring-hydroxylating ferredoxin subunit
LCPHYPVLLDFGDGDFLSPDRRLIQCRHHGALFEPSSGLCIAGPCMSASLRRIDLQEVDGLVLIPEPIRTVFE